MTIFIDRHPQPSLGWLVSSLIYADEDDEYPDSGPHGEADTLTEARELARDIKRANKKRMPVEIVESR